jgi:inward rectifier potassium channel
VEEQGGYRLTKRGARRFDWRDPYHVAVTLSWPNFALAMLATELAINLVFALLYWLAPGSVSNAAPGSYADAFFFSVETLATVGYGAMAPASLFGHIVASVELLVGMALTAIITGLTFVRFSRPRAKIIYADNPVVARYNGRPALMIRIANGRATPMTNAHARLSVLLAEQTHEGQSFRGVHELPLVRATVPIFSLTWTLIHVLDQASPLHGATAESLAAEQVRLFLTIDMRDEQLAARVQDIRTYGATDIRFGHRYADAVVLDADGNPFADLTRVSELEREPGAERG